MLKMLALALIAAVVLTLNGCTVKGDQSTNDDPPPVQTQSDVKNDGLGDIEVLGELSDTEVLKFDRENHQLYLVTPSTGEKTPLVADEAYGYTYQDYYDSVTKKNTWLEWCDNPTFNGNGNSVETPLVAYYSNKYCENGVITNEETCWSYGAIWLIDVRSGKEERIAPPEGYTVNGGFAPVWCEPYDVAFSVSDSEGESYYAVYNVEEQKTYVADIGVNEIISRIEEDYEFWKFREFGGFECDPTDTVTVDVDGESKEYVRVTDPRFDTPEKLNAYLNERYDPECISYMYYTYTERDGKIYHEQGLKEDYPFNKGASLEIRRIEDGEVMVWARSLYKEDTDFDLKTLYSFIKTDDGWKISWYDRNMSVIKGWENTDFPEVIGISERETAELLEKDAFIFENTELGCFAISEPGVPFDLSNYIERDGYAYYKIIDPDFDTWEEWEACVRDVYTGQKAEEILAEPYYISIDGALYGNEGGMGYYYERNNYAWHITDHGEDWIELQKSYGGGGENEIVINRDYYKIIHTPEGWRIQGYTSVQESPY